MVDLRCVATPDRTLTWARSPRGMRVRYASHNGQAYRGEASRHRRRNDLADMRFSRSHQSARSWYSRLAAASGVSRVTHVNSASSNHALTTDICSGS